MSLYMTLTSSLRPPQRLCTGSDQITGNSKGLVKRPNKPGYKARSALWQLKPGPLVDFPMTVNFNINFSLLSQHPILKSFCQFLHSTSWRQSLIVSTQRWNLWHWVYLQLTHTHTHIHTSLWHSLKFLLLANSQHTLGVAHHPGNTLAQAKLLGHVSLHTRPRQITKSIQHDYWVMRRTYSPTTRTERSQPIRHYAISTSFRFRTFRKPQLLI